VNGNPEISSGTCFFRIMLYRAAEATSFNALGTTEAKTARALRVAFGR